MSARAPFAPVVAIVGPSGVGKDTVMAALCASHPGIELVRRVITRPENAGGEQFTGVSEAVFDQIAKDGAFALHWRAHGLQYGIPVEIDEQRQRAVAVLVNLSRAVLREAQDRFGNLIVVSLTASPAVLQQRLSDRGRESAADQSQRLDRARMELPDGLIRMVEIDNSGALEDTVSAILDLLQPESA
ncbi:MAG: phosphonate metabolism protein/1,5-bisphosphokinase (PRPP-forming) PhnN [Paracoccaceae bacterium]